MGHTVSSATSVGSDQPTRRLPPVLDQAKLPPLPLTRRELEANGREESTLQIARAPLQSIRSAPVVSRLAEPPRPSLPPRLPSRPARSTAAEPAGEQGPALPTRRMPPPPTMWNRANSAKETGRSRSDDALPPVPVSSRPSFAQIDAVASRATAASARSASAPPGGCLVCRDFSGPDTVAERYPYGELPRADPVGYLAHHLCSPFPSATDKARAIFTWCHHNIAYDVHGFLNNCIPRGQTLDQTIFSGKAVCEGYAKVYEGIARRAGLECVVVCGHGKGYGYTPLAAGQAPPPRDAAGHAWNAVRIDNGEWKLLDACWGAGSLDQKQYKKHFKPQMFTLANELFGHKHFPEDPGHFYRSDGRIPTWEEYSIGPTQGEPATFYGNTGEEGFNEFTFSPREKHIPVHTGKVVRFQFGRVCEHWDAEKHGRGKPMLLMIKIYGVDGRGINGKKDDLAVLQNDGFWWYVDIAARDLGAPGQKLQLLGLKDFNGQDARGMTREKFLGDMANNRMRSISWDGFACWELV